jgi:UDP-2,3-diacylglucosamine pyrophosphatase LpxH
VSYFHPEGNRREGFLEEVKRCLQTESPYDIIAISARFDRHEGSHRSYVKAGVARPVIIPAYREVPVFIRMLKRNFERVIVCKGNHDGNIERLASKSVDIYEPSGFRLKSVLLTHGQAWPEKKDLKADYIVMGHVHPAVEFWTDYLSFSTAVFNRDL